jgi:hypothetical protein
MLSALIHSIEPGRICDIVPVGQEFEVHPNFTWVQVPDGTTTADTYFTANATVVTWNPLNQPGFAENAYKLARAIEYGSLADQLDMIYHELNTTGTISNTGPWATRVTNTKASIPKDDPAAVMVWNQTQWTKLQGNV